MAAFRASYDANSALSATNCREVASAINSDACAEASLAATSSPIRPASRVIASPSAFAAWTPFSEDCAATQVLGPPTTWHQVPSAFKQWPRAARQWAVWL